mgnify:CR=1 FL=1
MSLEPIDTLVERLDCDCDSDDCTFKLARARIAALTAEVARKDEALRKVMPISVEDGPDYASVYFGDGSTHSTQAMTMNPQDWLDISAALEARNV